MDFTLHKYDELLSALNQAGYRFLTFGRYLKEKPTDGKWVILRHDVDKRPKNSEMIAAIEHGHGIQASYYFRLVPQSYDLNSVRNIHNLGHEIGYHYEDMTIAHGDIDRAMAHFRQSLATMRMHAPIETICMHGSPKSPYDSRDLWHKYSYRDEGILGEPYFDMDFSQCLYLTDTGRCWDGYKVSVRDKIPAHQDEWIQRGWVFHTTDDLIHFLRTANHLPNLMITTHPQRWVSQPAQWLWEMVSQKLKNLIKFLLIYGKTNDK